MFCPKMAIFIGPKKIFDGSADRPHRVCHFELSYAPIPLTMWMGLKIAQNLLKLGFPPPGDTHVRSRDPHN